VIVINLKKINLLNKYTSLQINEHNIKKTILFADVSPGLNMSHSIMLIGGGHVTIMQFMSNGTKRDNSHLK
jgi:hypothetical protein